MAKALTTFSRSGIAESTHEVKILIAKSNGKILYSTNNDNDLIYPRSAIKIFQAIPFVQSKAIDTYKLNSKIVSLACSSHRGEKFHINQLSEWLNKVNISEKVLKCGVHYPLNENAKQSILRSNTKINQIYNNCAGKHLAMITSCLKNSYDIKNYLDFNHPHQKNIRKIFNKFSNTKITKKNSGIDGCSAPQYAFKIKDLSKMLSNLLEGYNNNFDYNQEIKILINSIISNPNYIGGTDSLDSKIMSISNKKIFCKGGAEGVFLFVSLSKKITGVIKVVDGNERAIPSVMFNLSKKFGLLTNTELNMLERFYTFKLTNHAKIEVGKIISKL